ncbi:hypothetical protein [Candidatus Nitronereus thalassa]|uniref:Uncharacterized protein n=1 Tax=Candidatus Nitronereus thalassa TaxID=3020898 RepID=A0ABU3K8C4_9BACT|nr:hypothetical protein [Candidatus Nitronereus thalassa]MDT7042617.1 hypothetical protein [Candidatus Nitronereus thalassa]
MSEFVRATLLLYRQALQATGSSLIRNWILIIAVIALTIFMFLITGVARPLGMLGGFLLGAANAFAVGALLGLLEQAVMSTRRMTWEDLWQAAGQYFWDVLTIGFIVLLPLQFLELGMQNNPYGPMIVSAIFFLLFLLLNPVPEIIYQSRLGSPLDSLKESYEFVLENWIEWFLPLAFVLAPFGLSFFFGISSQGGRLSGLDFLQLLQLPLAILSQLFQFFGFSSSLATVMVLLFTPIGVVAMMLFRGFLFKALHGSSRRQRQFRARSL